MLHIKHNATASAGDRFERRDQRVVARHPPGAENVAQQILAVHAHERWLRAANTHREREMMPLVDLAAKNVEGELAELGGKRTRGNELHKLIARAAIFDQR